jgi:hypothetical protein
MKSFEVNPGMPIKRRKLLQTGLSGLLLAPLAGQAAAPGTKGSIKAFAVDNDQAFPLIHRGTWILADTAETTWSGPGLYLYPHWGQPRAYQVTRAPGPDSSQYPTLEFRDTASGKLLWTVTQASAARFAGKICALGCELPVLVHLQLEMLEVPRLPPGNPSIL